MLPVSRKRNGHDSPDRQLRTPSPTTSCSGWAKSIPALDLAVYRNDQITLDEIEARQPSHLIISPGPCTPDEAGISVACIQRFAGRIPLLGVCLGHQSIGQAFGAKIVRAGRLMHGKTDQIHHDNRDLYAGLENPFTATRYHSLLIQPDTLPDEFRRVRLEQCPGRQPGDHGHPPQALPALRRAISPGELSHGTRDGPPGAVLEIGG